MAGGGIDAEGGGGGYLAQGGDVPRRVAHLSRPPLFILILSGDGDKRPTNHPQAISPGSIESGGQGSELSSGDP